MKPITIPEIEIEIGDNLYLQISDLTFTPFKKGYISGPPEDCYEDEGAEADWKDEDCQLLLIKNKINHYYDIDSNFVNEYYDQIILACEEYLNEQSNL
jgi:hypothetical protein